MSSRERKKTNNTRAKKKSSKEKTKSTKSPNKSNKSKKIEKSKTDKGSGLKAGGELGIDSGGRTVGKVRAGGELGVKENKQGTGKFEANVNLGLESETLGELKEGSDYAFDKIKSGIKAVKKKITQSNLPGMENSS